MPDNTPLSVRESTSAVSQWQRTVSSSFVPLDVHAAPGGAFHAQLDGRISDGVLFSTVTASAHTVERTAADIRTSSEHYVKLTLLLTGSGMLVQDDRTGLLTPGDIVLYDTSRPYTLEFGEDTASVIVMFPHRMIDADPESLKALTAIRIGGDEGFARAVSRFLAGIASALPALDGPTGLRITHNTMDLIATMVGNELRGATWGDASSELLFHIDTYINGHLGDPALSPETVAAANYISTRHLHALFQRRGVSVSQWIRQRRLEHVRRDLRDPRRASDSVASIASSWGFADPSHFSKVFREHVGVPPTVYRAATDG
ncbi:helix-turn-helix domain-containing protein [Microbacterium betulae]|uniref:Helix-turn-helix domain-containing protein n=1 Tax=Microbacterium betulae TaxID=2981139 RepID=A0AA97I5N7_9MICO|nr:helix-turn-helix domain-containing protein [Microbacterium sp. AB]WOF23941.1 helix-turn-helix domain-containing protein [Microbacterium sp. AB]